MVGQAETDVTANSTNINVLKYLDTSKIYCTHQLLVRLDPQLTQCIVTGGDFRVEQIVKTSENSSQTDIHLSASQTKLPQDNLISGR